MAGRLDPAGAALAAKERLLPGDAVHEGALARPSGGKALGQMTAMRVAPSAHLDNQKRMPFEQGSELPAPAQGLGMPRVALLAPSDDAPDGVEFAMLAQQMLAAEPFRMDIPDAHLAAA